MAFAITKKNTEVEQKVAQCERQIDQLAHQRKEFFAEIGKLYAEKNTAEDAAGTPYEEFILELDRIKAREAVLEKRKLAVQNQRECEKCGAMLSLDSIFCNKCGERLEEIPPEVLTDEPLCPSCKSPIEAGSTFCTRCGAGIAGAPQTQSKVSGVKICPKCGKPCGINDAFCIECGSQI